MNEKTSKQIDNIEASNKPKVNLYGILENDFIELVELYNKIKVIQKENHNFTVKFEEVLKNIMQFSIDADMIKTNR